MPDAVQRLSRGGREYGLALALVGVLLPLLMLLLKLTEFLSASAHRGFGTPADILIPFALGAVIYLCSLISPPPSASAGNALAVSPLVLFLLAAMVYWLGHGPGAGQDVPGRPAAPGDA